MTTDDSKFEIDPAVWAKVVEEQKAKEHQKKRELFGDREPFAIPEEPFDV